MSVVDLIMPSIWRVMLVIQSKRCSSDKRQQTSSSNWQTFTLSISVMISSLTQSLPATKKHDSSTVILTISHIYIMASTTCSSASQTPATKNATGDGRIIQQDLIPHRPTLLGIPIELRQEILQYLLNSDTEIKEYPKFIKLEQRCEECYHFPSDFQCECMADGQFNTTTDDNDANDANEEDSHEEESDEDTNCEDDENDHRDETFS